MEINVVKEYTDKPGARYEYQGPKSGEKFRDELLYPKFIKSVENNEILTVNLDGGYGYGSSFLEEAFGGLVRRLKKENDEKYKKVQNILIISNDNKTWIEKIKGYIEEAVANPLSKES
ncbi:MAG: STAS-like domain-containing protein [Oscillospiraceae bacterium]|nr:STAS-like domain-containing protein [Oscillospiraceae bacterium]